MPSIHKLLFTSLLTAAALLAQGPPPPHPGGGRGPGGPGFDLHVPPVAGAPFSATGTFTHQVTLADGNQIEQSHTAQVYRDTQGRTRMEMTMKTPSGTTKTMVTIMDPVAGFMAHLNPADSTAFKQTLPPHHPSDAAARHEPPAGEGAPQVVKTDLGTATIAGVPATGTRSTITIPAGAMGNAQAITESREVWTSTALKIPLKVTMNSPLHGSSSMVVTNLSQTVPEASLFEIPSSYTVKDAPAHHAHGGPDGPPPPAGDVN